MKFKPTRLYPGDKVKLKQSNPDGTYNLTECGIVLHSWYDDFLKARKYYVAFFGDTFPEKDQKCEKPYVLNYMEGSLEKVD